MVRLLTAVGTIEAALAVLFFAQGVVAQDVTVRVALSGCGLVMGVAAIALLFVADRVNRRRANASTSPSLAGFAPSYASYASPTYGAAAMMRPSNINHV
ncbi:MAG: hypothetical protein AAGF19_04655 [Pseudomonadota bacterium]